MPDHYFDIHKQLYFCPEYQGQSVNWKIDTVFHKMEFLFLNNNFPITNKCSILRNKLVQINPVSGCMPISIGIFLSLCRQHCIITLLAACSYSIFLPHCATISYIRALRITTRCRNSMCPWVIIWGAVRAAHLA